MRKNITKKNNGFTLIELMVSISIFSIIMLTAIGSFLVTVNVAKKARALRFAMDNVNFATESMTRSLRMGKDYYCEENSGPVYLDSNLGTKDCSGGTFIAFIPQKSNSYVAYKQKEESSGFWTLERCNSTGVCIPIVSPDVNVKKLNFIVKGSNPNDKIQPSVRIIMQGDVMVNGHPVSFTLQTMASQRNF